MQLIQPAAGVQCGENLLLRSYLHPFTGAEPERRRKWVIHRGLHSERCVGIWRLQEFSRAHKAGRAHKGNEVKQMPRFDPEVWRTSRLVSIDDTPNRAPPEHSRGPSMDEHARLSHAKYERKIQRRVQMTRQSVRQEREGPLEDR